MNIDTPMTEARLFNAYVTDSVMRKLSVEVVHAEFARTLELELRESNSEITALRAALKGLYDDQMDYIRLNRLAGAENNHWMVSFCAGTRLA